MALFLEAMREFGRGGCFTGAVHSHHQNYVKASGYQIERIDGLLRNLVSLGPQHFGQSRP